MEPVSLVWATPNIDALIAKIARVSNPSNEDNQDTAPRLIRYLIRHKHWSPFEMVSVCMEIHTTRDIARQILRHRSFSFQEFSQRYAAVDTISQRVLRETRLQDHKNRQNSVAANDPDLSSWFEWAQKTTWNQAASAYRTALAKGIAKEQARALLPEGLTPSRLYMAGTLRSWLHYCDLRRANGTQAEHAHIADAAWAVIKQVAPACAEAFEQSTP